MSPRALLRLLPHMEEGVHTLNELSSKSGLGRALLREVLTSLRRRGVEGGGRGRVVFAKGDKIRAALEAVRLGSDPAELSRLLTWRDFEAFLGAILEENHYTVYRNLRLKKPPAEIDVLGVRGGQGVAVDCKHWRRTGGVSRLFEAAALQVRRAQRLFTENQAEKMGVECIVPVIATLYEESFSIVRGVPLVLVSQFDGFLQELPGRLDEFTVIRGG